MKAGISSSFSVLFIGVDDSERETDGELKAERGRVRLVSFCL